ncbi:Glycosyltransferase, GT2 family [Nonlabens sp. Hel1_33_55]|uniref:glycosyltransferase family 2 protein n=1 Tax=Nonlabens sp. Hel1_33_55 TaxID=1336802 RepID=UPI000875E786|nr:glycosyltransferase family 2 protein [Nonlabens sp. Hel1_33_55]SCX87157.1 Glycosyltransferase, GT2 family [Nonlabens sp. Hel1_33_55]
MKLSVIILNYNARVFLELCVESVLRATQHLDAEVIVADNDSTDDSIERLLRIFPQVKVIRLDDNYGFSKGNNVAVEQARGEYICLVNPDVIVGEQVFENCLAFFNKKDQEVNAEPNLNIKAEAKSGFLGIKLIDGSGKYLPESKRRIPTRKGILKKMLGFSDSYYDQRIQEDENGPTEILVGAFLMTRKSVYLELGGLDERYFMYGEDIDLTYTATKYGFHNYYLGSETAIHFKGESTVKDAKYLERFYGAMYLFYEKHYPNGKWLSKFLKFAAPKLLGNKKPEAPQEVDQLPLVCVTNDDEYQPEWAERSMSFNDFTSEKDKSCKYVFDLDSLDNSNLIQNMNRTSGITCKYRFLNPNRTAYAGSDSSSYRGEVRIL